jgi:hypothetical protein
LREAGILPVLPNVKKKSKAFWPKAVEWIDLPENLWAGSYPMPDGIFQAALRVMSSKVLKLKMDRM